MQLKKELSVDPSVGSFPEENLALSMFFPEPTIAPLDTQSEMNEIQSQTHLGESESASANDQAPVSFADNPLARPNPLSWDWVEASEAFSPNTLENHEQTETAYHIAKMSDEEREISEKLSNSDSSLNPKRELSPLSLNPSTEESYQLYYSEPSKDSDDLAIVSEKKEASIVEDLVPHSPSKSPKSPSRERAFLEIRAPRSASAEKAARPLPPARPNREGNKIPQGEKPVNRGRSKAKRK